MALQSSGVVRPQLLICSFSNFNPPTQDLAQFLDSDRYRVIQFNLEDEFFSFVEREKHQIDCLILTENSKLLKLAARLHNAGILLPVVIFRSDLLDGFRHASTRSKSASEVDSEIQKTFEEWEQDSVLNEPELFFHSGEVQALVSQLPHVAYQIDQAITEFLKLSPTCWLPNHVSPPTELTTQSFLMVQQRRLAEKLKERLGYLGVYYKRDSQCFLRCLPELEKQKCLDELKSDYRNIVLNYFRKENGLNQKIDQLVNKAFFLDVSVSQILEIHMELMEIFAKQLKLEGRSEEILLDYRLTLIDIIAHLCEMYRRSIPRQP